MKNNKVKFIILAAAIFTLLGVYSFNAAYSFEKNTSSAGSSVTDSTVTKTYTCPMHPEVISDKPGSCPKCGMDLELKEDKDKSDVKEDVKNDKGMDHKDCKGCMHKH
jgi:flagellar basal body-associated protein FliL